MKPLAISHFEDLHFGARVSGLTEELTRNGEVRARLNALFEERGVIVFEDVEPTLQMQKAISDIFGPPKPFPMQADLADAGDDAANVLQIKREPGAPDNNIVEVGGKLLANWRPWHFDHAYTDELNRGGVLRPVINPAKGGETGFVDGIQLYRDISPELRDRIEGLSVIYTMDTLFQNMRFGKPRDFREVVPETPEVARHIMELSATMPRACHPAVWTRKTGEKVLHVSGQHSVGIEGHEDPEGDALLEAVCQEIIEKAIPYFHAWKPRDMVLWDNWRMLHGVAGIDPNDTRVVNRTTIKGDYGLGYYEKDARSRSVSETATH